MTTTTDLVLQARNATLENLVDILRGQRERALDVVAPAASIRMRGGLVEVPATGEATLTDEGVDAAPGLFRPLRTFDAGLAEKLPGIPAGYVRWLRENRPDLLDANVNGLLHGRVRNAGGRREVVAPPLEASFMLRLFRGNGGPGVARALVSDRYRPIDHLDVLTAALDAVHRAREAGQITGEPEVRNLNLTDESMHVRITVPDIATSAPVLTAGYRDPFAGGDGRAPGWQPPRTRPRKGDVVWAGLDLTNNEVGAGAFWLTPVIMVCVCDNGQVSPREAIKTVHVGSRLEEGVIAWSDETRNRNMELVISKTRDAIGTFLSREFLEGHVARVEARAGAPVTDPAATIQVVARRAGFTDAEQAKVLEHFIRGGQLTAAGVANAVTSAAQTVESPADAIDMEYKALAALDAAADLAEAAP